MEHIKAIKKIDIHAHATAFPEFFPPLYPNGQRMISAEELLSVYDQVGVDQAVLLPIASPEGQLAAMTNEACKMLSDRYPDRFLWFCNVDPRAMANDGACDLSGLLSHYQSLGARGCGEVTANIYMDDNKTDRLFSACEELGLPVTIHIAPEFKSYGLVDELGLPRLEKMLKKHPKLKILGHSQPFWSEISGDVTEKTRGDYPTGTVIDGRVSELMRNYPNLYCDISAGSGLNAFMRDPEYASRFIEEFSDRILFGLDMCLPTQKHPFVAAEFFDKLLDEGAISPENYKKVLRENAVKILKLEK